MLAVCWAVSRCKLFLTGLQHFTIITDHNPLIPILNNHHLDEIENPRLQRLKTRLMAYTFTAEWFKGSKNNAPDALSCNPVSDPQPHELLAELDIDNNPDISFTEVRSMTNESLCLTDLRKNCNQDPEYQQLKNILNGFPDYRSQLLETCRRYWNICEHLTLDDDLIVNGCRLLIPFAMHKQVLSQLHESHQGTVRTKQHARLSIYWPGIDNDIENTILACQQCQDHLPSHTKEPLIQKPNQTDHFKRLLWTSVPMLAMITTSLLTVILTGQPSSPWIVTPQPHKSSQPSGSPSAALGFQISYGLMKDPSLHPRSLLTFHTNGASYTRPPLHIILKVMVR